MSLRFLPTLALAVAFLSLLWVAGGLASRGDTSLTPAVAAQPDFRPRTSVPSPPGEAVPRLTGGLARPVRHDEEPSAIDSSFSEAELLAFRQEALALPPDSRVQRVAGAGGIEFSLGTQFESIDIAECCQSGTLNPPDPELAVGPDHIIAVVNSSLEIYDKSGTSLAGPLPFESFFSSLPGPCTAFPFDPNALYDESADRFVIAADGNFDSYCVGVTQTGDPLGAYYFYDFATNVNGADFDYPHAGVGVDAIYVGANMFGASGHRVFAFDKLAMYAGLPAAATNRDLGSNGTPQPMNIHGGSLSGGSHYILTSRGGTSNPSNFGLFSWDDPFGADVLVDLGTINTTAVHGVSVGFPVSIPQMGGGNITAFNPRPLDFEYRDGFGWFANMVSCNPGSGTIGCIQWAQVDLAGATAVDAGVFADDLRYRFMPDLAVNSCGDMMIGYSVSNSTSFPGIAAAGRESGDPAGEIQGELDLKAGETAFGGASRWGDYTGMTIDPDGSRFWYLGEYSKANGDPRNWGTMISSLTFADCVLEEVFSDGFESGDLSAWSEAVP